MLAGNGKGRGRRVKPGLGLVLALLAVLAAGLYVSGGIRVYRPDPARRDEIERNVQVLYALEHAPTVDLDEEAKRLYRELLNARGGVLVDDLAAEQQRILETEGGAKADIARWFSDAAIVGDSIVHSIIEYGWLSEPPVFSKIGVRALANLALLDEVEAAKPEIIFLCFGLNDMDSYGSKAQVFAQRYAQLVQRLKSSLPDAVIYVNAVFPVTQATAAKHSNYQYVDLYNEELRGMCEEQGVYFIDSGFILKQLPELFEPDGIHMKRKFYPRWLTYLADVSGLSNDDE